MELLPQEGVLLPTHSQEINKGIKGALFCMLEKIVFTTPELARYWFRQNHKLDIDGMLSIKSLTQAPHSLSYEGTIDRYVSQLEGGYNFLSSMKDRNQDQYMQLIHQKSYAKAYFVPLLQDIFDFCDEKGYQVMAQAMYHNIKDETGERVSSKTDKTYDQLSYITPEGTDQEPWRGESHAARRFYEYQGILREYGKTLDRPQDIGITVFNYIVGELLRNKTEQYQYMKIGAVAFAETVIPLEFTYMQEARDRLFPGLTPQERHYMDDHIAHDVEFHMRDILVGLAEMNLTPEQEQRIKDGMYLYYIGRSFMYSDFMDNLESSSKQNSS